MYLPLGRQGVRLVAQVPGHNKKALRRGGNIIAPFCLPVNRYLKICPTTAHFFAAGSRSVPDGVAEPLPYRLTLPLWCLKGGVPSLPPANPTFSFVSCPYPPCPPSRREGGDQGFFHARGCAPCIPGIKPFAALARPAPGARLLPRPPILPLALFPAPIPPDPLPGGKGGESRLFHARGFAPCIPGIKPFAALIDFVAVVPCGGACLVCRPPTVLFSCFPAPIPPRPPSRREGGDQGYFMQGAAPLASPRLNPRGTYRACQTGSRRKGKPTVCCKK